MAKKSLKSLIQHLTFDKRDLNEKVLIMNQSVKEVRKIIDGKKAKTDKK